MGRFFISFTSLNIMRHGPNSCSSCRNMLTFLSIDGSSDVLLFLGRTRKFAILRSKNPRKAKDDCIFEHTKKSLREIYSHVEEK
jgi:hypothetical protein